MTELKEVNSKCESLSAKLAAGGANDILKNAKEINGITVLTGMANGAGIDGLRALGDSKRPLYLILINAFTKIVLDLLEDLQRKRGGTRREVVCARHIFSLSFC